VIDVAKAIVNIEAQICYDPNYLLAHGENKAINVTTSKNLNKS